MVKYKYKVVKPFVISEEEGERVFTPLGEEKSPGTTFKKGAQYVDYCFPSKGLEKNDLTASLVDEGYIVLENQKKKEVNVKSA